MQVSSGKGRNPIFGEINITPLTDIFLVLLIIMMVVAPMMQKARSDIRPPEITSGSPVPKNECTVEIASDGKYYFNGVEATEADLTRLIRDTADQLGDKRVTIRADRASKGHAVMTVFNAAQEAGMEKIMVIGEVQTRDGKGGNAAKGGAAAPPQQQPQAATPGQSEAPTEPAS